MARNFVLCVQMRLLLSAPERQGAAPRCGYAPEHGGPPVPLGEATHGGPARGATFFRVAFFQSLFFGRGRARLVALGACPETKNATDPKTEAPPVGP